MVGAHDGGYYLVFNLHFYMVAGLGRSPDGIWLAALRLHVVAEDGAYERKRLGGRRD
jgi:hypothetical protein